jgi:hypothetical protein
MPAHKIDFYLNSSNSLRQLADEARRIAELQRVFLKTAPPPLTQACCVRQLRAGTLSRTSRCRQYSQRNSSRTAEPLFCMPASYAAKARLRLVSYSRIAHSWYLSVSRS